MWNNKVIWSEGMFLRPAHFQQHVRYVENLLERRCDSLHSHPWGFANVKIDEALLRLGKLGIAQAQGVFPDGTPFNIPSDEDAPLPLDLGDADVRDMQVYLCLPVRRFGALEVGGDGAEDGMARHTLHEFEVADTHTETGESAAIQVGRLKLTLQRETNLHGGLIPLGLARIVERREDGSLLIDEAFIPPALDCRAAAPLASHVKELHGMLRQRGEALAARVSAAGRGGMSEVADFLLLQVTNRYEALVSHLTTRGRLHPQEFYAMGVQLAGELATFTHPQKRLHELVPYRHADPQPAFRMLMDELRRSLSMVMEQSALPLPLEERKYGIRVSTITDRSLLKNSSFVLAIRAQMPVEELRRHFPSQVKLASVEQIRQLVNLQLPGIQLRPLAVAPRQLPYHANFVYFELERTGELWAGLANSGGFAIHVSGEFPGLEMEFWAIRS